MTEGLLRNVTGTTRERHPGEALPVGTLEEAIGRNVRELRRTAGLTVADLADQVGISKAMLSKVENAQTSSSLTTISALAAGLEVPVTSLFRGADTEREAVHTIAGTGPAVARAGTREGHIYEGRGALHRQHARLEPLVVTLTADSETYPLFQHPGTEFIYMLEGRMTYSHSRSTYELGPGDSLLFDGEGQHGPVSLDDLPIRFLSVVAYPDKL
jgi:transcriptional regulator with XRE-family HTH domain